MGDASPGGRVTVVTGAGAGLGRADEAADELKGLGAEVAIAEGDVGERATADAVVAAAVEGLGRLGVVVNNAGMTRDRVFYDLSDEEWGDVIRAHLRGQGRHHGPHALDRARHSEDGVHAHTIRPRARTAMTAQVFGEDTPGQEVDPYSPEHVALVVAYLASPGASGSPARYINGAEIAIHGGVTATHGPAARS